MALKLQQKGIPKRMISAGEENGVPLETGLGGGLQGPPSISQSRKVGKGQGWAMMNYQASGIINVCTSKTTMKSTTQGLTKDVL